ncbi:hypothetical protein [Synechococcus sp. H70.1]
MSSIANQVGVALLQAEAYRHLEELNCRLQAAAGFGSGQVRADR